MSQKLLLPSLCPLLVTLSCMAFAELPIPPNPRWEPVVDEVYMQEAGSRIETETPLLSVAVWNESVYAGHHAGVFKMEADRLVDAGGPSSEVQRLRVLDGALWAVGPAGLWRCSEGNWAQVAAGAYADVCLHLGRVIAVTEAHLFAFENNEPVPLDGEGSRRPILGAASYSETLYVRHADCLGFLQNGRYEYNDVQDWGHLPRQSVTRDLLALGSRLLVPTNKGLAVLRGMSWTTLTGEDGLCCEDTTCVAEGFDRDYWVGTARGAIRAVNGEYHYFGCDRWLPHEKVNAIACGPQAAYIATDAGLGIIRYEPYTLQKKAAWYKRWIDEWGMKRLGFISTLNQSKEGKWIRFLSDNDVGWVCHYLDALCFEYAVTGDPAVKEEAIDVFKSVKWSEEITPIDGFPARAIYAVGEEANLAATGSAGRPSEWNLTGRRKVALERRHLERRDRVAVLHPCPSSTISWPKGDVRAAAQEHIQRITDHIIDHGPDS